MPRPTGWAGLVLCTGLVGAGCRTVQVHVRATEDINDGQPVALHVHQLRKIPAGLRDMSCDDLRPGQDEDPIAGERLGEPTVLSALPGQRMSVNIDRFSSAKWVLVAPEWAACDGAIGWALVPLAPAGKHVRVEVSERDLMLPWDRRPQAGADKAWKQKGYIDGRPFHVTFKRARATRR